MSTYYELVYAPWIDKTIILKHEDGVEVVEIDDAIVGYIKGNCKNEPEKIQNQLIKDAIIDWKNKIEKLEKLDD